MRCYYSRFLSSDIMWFMIYYHAFSSRCIHPVYTAVTKIAFLVIIIFEFVTLQISCVLFTLNLEFCHIPSHIFCFFNIFLSDVDLVSPFSFGVRKEHIAWEAIIPYTLPLCPAFHLGHSPNDVISRLTVIAKIILYGYQHSQNDLFLNILTRSLLFFYALLHLGLYSDPM